MNACLFACNTLCYTTLGFIPNPLVATVITLFELVFWQYSHCANHTSYSLLDDIINIVCFSETWLSDDLPDALVAVDQYKIFRLDRRVLDKKSARKAGGGVCVFVKKTCSTDSYVYDKYNCSDANIEILCLKVINGGNKSIALLNIYRPPTRNLFIISIIIFSELLHVRRRDVICTGDFNIGLLVNNSKSKQLLSLICK